MQSQYLSVLTELSCADFLCAVLYNLTTVEEILQLIGKCADVKPSSRFGMPKNVLAVEWKACDGAARKRRMLKITPNADGMLLCPVENCLHLGFKSKRGARKHIDSRHPWYYYFDVQPTLNRQEAKEKEKVKLKQPTHNYAAFSMEEGVGKQFLIWLSTPCGGGKTAKEGMQIGRRAMKFLMASMGDTEVETYVKEEYVDCCLGSPSVVIAFMHVVSEEWGLSSSGCLNYLKAMCDLLDFRKATGVTDAVLRTFTVTEVYLRRGKENLAKRKRLDCDRNLDLETLIARDSWASIEEMEEVIPHHTPRYTSIVTQCSDADHPPKIADFAFATRFIATFLFLRVKCARPMTFQFLTVEMLERAKSNGGFIDQTAFKTSEKFIFDTLILSDDVMEVLQSYATVVRPLLNPTCDYLLVSTTGRQYNSFTTAMTLLVNEAIGKYINPTRYRQIVETESEERLQPHERDIISQDQKHSSRVAKRSYIKKLSRDVATKGKECMEKIVGTSRSENNKQLADIVRDINTNSMQFDHAVIEATRNILKPTPQLEPTFATTSPSHPKSDVCDDASRINLALPPAVMDVESVQAPTEPEIAIQHASNEDEVAITSTTQGMDELTSTSSEPGSILNSGRVQEITNDVEVKKEELDQHVAHTRKSKRFTAEEDSFLREGIRKYGKQSWSQILHDGNYKFNPARSRDSLRMRAETCAFKIRKNL